MNISLIVAIAQNGIIGGENKLIWYLPDDLKRFKHLTTGHPIIMGRKTFESIGKPLPNRISIVITRNKNWSFEGVIVVNSVEDAIQEAKQTGTDEVFVIGGAEIYKFSLPIVNKIYLTEVKGDFEGDTYFVIPHMEEWIEISRVPHSIDEKHVVSFDFVDLVRK